MRVSIATTCIILTLLIGAVLSRFAYADHAHSDCLERVEAFLSPKKFPQPTYDQKNELRRIKRAIAQKQFEPLRGGFDLEWMTTVHHNRLLIKSVPKALKHSGYKKDFWEKYYDKKTGAFNYHIEEPFHLALDNGDQQVKAFRIHFTETFFELGKSVDAELFQSYVHVLEKMPKAELYVVTSTIAFDDFEKHLKGFPEQLQKRIHLVGTGGDLSHWARDGSVSLKDRGDNKIHILKPRQMLRGAVPESETALEALADHGHFQVHTSLFEFEGGDIIAGEKHVFIGASAIEKFAQTFFVSRAKAVEVLSKEFGKPVVAVSVPSSRERVYVTPELHIDLSMSVVRDRKSNHEVILLDSPWLMLEKLTGQKFRVAQDPSQQLGAVKKKLQDLFEKMKSKNFDKFHLNWTDSEQQLVSQLLTSDLYELLIKQLQLDFLEKRFKALGYVVQRVPGVNFLNLKPELPQSQKIFSSANSIFSGEYAIVPGLGVKFLDEEVKNVVQDLGYKVIEMPVASQYYCRGGGVRCATEVYR